MKTEDYELEVLKKKQMKRKLEYVMKLQVITLLICPSTMKNKIFSNYKL